MEQNKIDLNGLLVLILLTRKGFQDSYSLVKVLAWKFGIINASEILEKLKKDNYISSTTNKGLKEYQIIPIGLDCLESNRAVTKHLLLKQYKSEEAFIEALFS